MEDHCRYARRLHSNAHDPQLAGLDARSLYVWDVQGTVEIHDSPLGGAQFCVRWPKNLTLEMEKAA